MIKGIHDYITFLKTVKESPEGILCKYCKNHPESFSERQIRAKAQSVRDALRLHYNEEKVLPEEDVILYGDFLALYESVKYLAVSGFMQPVDMPNELEGVITTTSIEETDDRAECSIIRDDNGKIKYYSYKIYRRNTPPLEGTLTREEMNSIYRLYSYYGDGMTQRQIVRHFPDLSLIDFKRILRAFNITKASSPFAPHMYEEYSEDELREIQSRERENSFLRKAEEDRIRDNERLLKQFYNENVDLKKQLNELTNFKVELDNVEPYIPDNNYITNQSINLYLADMHLGATVTTGTLYKENINYGKEECKRRLEIIIRNLKSLGPFNVINLVLMGDNVDCCGIPNKTYKQTHYMPENMDPKDQVNSFLTLAMWFIDSLYKGDICNTINVYTVPNGNHGGNLEYAANKALIGMINAKYPKIYTEMWEKFYGKFTIGIQTFICMHGRDSEYMKKGFPLDLNDSTKVKLYEWLHYEGIHENGIHFIKGDLHTSNINSCMRMDYRNVLSLFGASDYSSMNYSRSPYGMSYDIIKGDIGEFLIRGDFENV